MLIWSFQKKKIILLLLLTLSPSSVFIFIHVNLCPKALKSQNCKSLRTYWKSFAPIIFPFLKDNFSSFERIWLKSPIQSQLRCACYFKCLNCLNCCHTSPLLAWSRCPYTKVIERGNPLLSSKLICIRFCES